MLDAGIAFQGMGAHRGRVQRLRAAADDAAAVPVCRFFGTPGVGPNSHFYTADASRVRDRQAEPGLDVRGHRVLHRGASSDGIACAAGTTSRCTAASIPGADRQRVESPLPARPHDASRRWREARCSKAWSCARRCRRAQAGRRRAPAGAGDVRTQRRARRARASVWAQTASSTSNSPRRLRSYSAHQVRARWPAADVLPDRSRSDCARDNYTLFQRAGRLLPQRAAAPTSCASASRSRCRRSS